MGPLDVAATHAAETCSAQRDLGDDRLQRPAWIEGRSRAGCSQSTMNVSVSRNARASSRMLDARTKPTYFPRLKGA
jgi:hypothetical protein